jgi:hypothetical protein
MATGRVGVGEKAGRNKSMKCSLRPSKDGKCSKCVIKLFYDATASEKIIFEYYNLYLGGRFSLR